MKNLMIITAAYLVNIIKKKVIRPKNNEKYIKFCTQYLITKLNYFYAKPVLSEWNKRWKKNAIKSPLNNNNFD